MYISHMSVCVCERECVCFQFVRERDRVCDEKLFSSYNLLINFGLGCRSQDQCRTQAVQGLGFRV
jgi:hypothetical protein